MRPSSFFLFLYHPAHDSLMHERSKRVEAQLKDLGEKSDKKKNEVRPPARLSVSACWRSTLMLYSAPFVQLVEIQAALQQKAAPAAA